MKFLSIPLFLLTLGSCGGSADPTTAKGFNSTWTPQYNNLVEYWGMSGSAFTDGSVFYADLGDNGTIKNTSGSGMNLVSGPVTFATHFNGNSAWVAVPYRHNANLGQFTLSLWARITGGSGQRVLVASASGPVSKGYILSINGSGQPEVKLGQGSANSWGVATGHVILNNVWTHLVFTYDGTWIRLYQNGVLLGSSLSAYATNITQPLYIAAGGTESSPSAGDFFTGDIDEVALWSGVLTDSEVETIYQRQKL